MDVKGRGCESALVAMLRAARPAGALPDLSQSADIVETVRTVAANARTAISIGGYISRRANRWHPRAWRERLLHELAAGRFGDVMLHHKLVEAEIVAHLEELDAALTGGVDLLGQQRHRVAQRTPHRRAQPMPVADDAHARTRDRRGGRVPPRAGHDAERRRTSADSSASAANRLTAPSPVIAPRT